MKTELKDVLHLYIGSNLLVQGGAKNPSVEKLVGVNKDISQVYTIKNNGEVRKIGWNWTALILKPLRLISEDEMIDIYTLATTAPINKKKDRIKCKHSKTKTGKFICCEIELVNGRYVVSVDADGNIDAFDKTNGYSMIVDSQSKIFAYLLERGYDLFGLLKDNSGIDITEVHKYAK